eukprot:gene1539-1677_t
MSLWQTTLRRSVRSFLAPSLPTWRRALSSKSSNFDSFYQVAGPNPGDNTFSLNTSLGATIRGEIVDNAVDIKNVRPGERIEVPYEVTVSPSFRDFWQSAFYSHDRINTSTPFARSLALQDQVVPFSLMLFLAASMSHADHAKLQVGFEKATYHWPAFAGDTFKKAFIIRSLRSTSDQQNSLLTVHCQLINQRGVVVFSCEKVMLFPFVVPPSEVVLSRPPEAKRNDFLDHLVKQAEALRERGSHTLSVLRAGQLLLHTLTRPLSETHMMQLACLGRLTHERHFNRRLYRQEEMFVPGGLVFGLTTSLASRDLHEVLFEDLIGCAFPNNLAPGDTVGAMTFVKNVEEHVSGDIEGVTIRTIGVKNCDVHRVLQNRDLPTALFTRPLDQLRPAALEELLKKTCPELTKLIVCIADRKIYRQAPKQVPFLL